MRGVWIGLVFGVALMSVVGWSADELEKKQYFYRWFVTGAVAEVDLELPFGEQAQIVDVWVQWEDPDEKTQGQLYVDERLHDFPRDVSKYWSTERWYDVNRLGRTVKIRIEQRPDVLHAKAARIDSITVTYLYPAD